MFVPNANESDRLTNLRAQRCCLLFRHSWSTVIWFLSLNYTPCHFVILWLKLGMIGWPQRNKAAATWGQLFESFLKGHFSCSYISGSLWSFKAFHKADCYWSLKKKKTFVMSDKGSQVSDQNMTYVRSRLPWELVEFFHLVVSLQSTNKSCRLMTSRSQQMKRSCYSGFEEEDSRLFNLVARN